MNLFTKFLLWARSKKCRRKKSIDSLSTINTNLSDISRMTESSVSSLKSFYSNCRSI